MIVTKIVIDTKKLAAAVRKVERLLKPDVVRIMYTYRPDHTGEDSLFFRVLITDEASAEKNMRKTYKRVEQVMEAHLKTDQLGIMCYFNYRNESEQRQLREKSWERP